MKTMEFGQQHTDVVFLLHGGGLSWWNYRKVAALLGERYHVVLPILDGHAGSDAAFTSIEENAARIIDHIDRYFSGQVLAIGGLSLGGQILVEILAQRSHICRFALIESALIQPMKLTRALIGPVFGMSYGLIRQKWFARLQAAYLKIPKALFDDYFRDTCQIQKEDMIAFLKANCAYTVKEALSLTTAKVKIVAGSAEQRSIIASARQLQARIPNSSMEILVGSHHGELSMGDPEEYLMFLLPE